MISFALRRPVAVLMLTLAAALCGVVAGARVPIELLPETELPRLTVRATWPGASPEQTEAFLTAPLEAVVQQVAGVETVRSVSEEQGGAGVANVEVEFARGTDMDFARLELSERLAALEDALPPNARRPVVEPYVPDEFQAQTRPFLRYTVTGPYTTEALRGYLDDRLLPELRQVAGVADARSLGGRPRVLDVELDETRLLSLGLTPEAVRARIAALESGRAVGVLRRGGVEYALRIDAAAATISELERLPVAGGGGRVVRLSDVAKIHDGYEEPYSYYRIDGRPAVSFDVFRRAGSNAVRVADAVKAKVATLEGAHPAGVRLLLDEDESTAIRAQFSDLRLRALSGALVVLLVLIAFLRSARSAAVVFASISFTMLLVLNLVYFAGLSLNLLTLMGLAMGFGLVIDNAIVVIENIDRRLRGGDALAEAAERGAKDMVLPVLASTLTNVVVFIPFFYLQGDLRLYYLPMAVVVGVVNLASLLVTFSLTPALAARVMGGSTRGRSPHPPAPSPTRGEGENGRTDQVPLSPRGRGGAARGTSVAGVRGPLYLRAYTRLVRTTLRWPKTTVLLAVLLLGGTGYLFQKHVTRGRVWQAFWGEETRIEISIRQPRGEELANTDLLARRFEALLAEMPEVARFTSRVYPYGVRIEVAFPDSLVKSAAPLVVKDRLTTAARQVGGASVSISGFGPGFYGGGGGSVPSYGIQVLGYNYETVREIAEDLGRRLQRYPRIREVDTNSASGWYTRDRATEIVLRLDRAALALHGLSAADAVHQVASLVGAYSRRDVLRLNGEELGLLVRTGDSGAVDVRALEDLLIPSPGGGAVRLGEVATLEEREVLGRIVRKDQQYERVVAYEFRGPVKLGDRVQSAVLESTRLPVGYSVAPRAGWSWSPEEQRQIYAVLAAALVLVFMITAALFESLRQPLVVLLTVPMALVGVFLAFLLTRATFTREAFIGVIMMSGVVVNNAILLVDRVNGLRLTGGAGEMKLGEAVLRGTLERVRPILMTNATTILGMLPLVLFGDAADAKIWNALTYALIGGLASAAVLVLTVTPALYLLFERRAAARAVSPALTAAAAGFDLPAPQYGGSAGPS